MIVAQDDLKVSDLSAIPTQVLCKRIANFKFSSLSREKLEEVYICISSGTTRVCPRCLNTALLELRTQNLKICPDCDYRLPWTLSSGQNPFFNHHPLGDSIMGMTKGRTICSKHDEILTLSERLSNILSGQKSITSFSDTEAGTLEDTIDNCSVLQTFLWLLKGDVDTIHRLADDAKQDGISMESGLDRKRTELRELTESLETAKSRIAYLSSLLENQND
jgi:hypothetical protein